MLQETSHPRDFRTYRYVYPVLSRRSKGISVGVNLSPDKACNFDCIYCQVDRTRMPPENFVGLDDLRRELGEILDGLKPGGGLWSEPEFAGISLEKARVNDIAFSGDGEPTTFRNFADVIRVAAEAKRARGFSEAKLVLITNATGLHRPGVQEGLTLMDANQGEVWAKLDAGTPEYFRLIDRTDFPFDQVLKNILACARARPTVIQSCFMRVNGSGPSQAEIAAFVRRLETMRAEGGRLARVQVYTVARPPAYGVVSSLPNDAVEAIAAEVRAAGFEAEAFHGAVEAGQGLMGEAPPDA